MYRPGGVGGGTGGIRGRGWQSGRVNGLIVLGVCKQERPGRAGTGRNGDRLTERAGGTYVCWQSGRVNRLRVIGVGTGSRKGQVGPVQQ